MLKSGKPGKTKVRYSDVDDAVAWLWKFVDGAKSAGEPYGRTMVVFAAQHYAKQLIEPAALRPVERWIGERRSSCECRFVRLGEYLAEGNKPKGDER